ncbi:hydrolase [Roseibium aquae]|uniref:Hydrolase n=1 Tax=Roseibium aquae TaxID=1323746 RepID=A0A916TNV4_9HYPH|nr:alpha/beta hydrolase [Roseibium aquae]GGB61432.1 hydrolase [Roseibium aquae]
MREPIVFIPGLLCDELVYAPQIAAFADHPILIANHRDHGSIREIAASILEAGPERFALIGLSMGGYIAMEIMRVAPGRVTRLSLLDTNARPDTPDQTERRLFLIELARKKDFKKIPHLLFPGFVHQSREDDEQLRAIVVEMAMTTGPDAFIRQQTALINRIDSRPHLAAIDCPALVVVGEGDRLTPPELSEEIHALIPRSCLAVIRGSGHLSTLEEPAQTTSVLKSWMESS